MYGVAVKLQIKLCARPTLRHPQAGSSGTIARRRSKGRALIFHLVACTLVAAAAAWLQIERIEPLSMPAATSPPGVHLAWAGAPLRGYVESIGAYVTSCGRPAYFKVTLIPAVGRPWTPPAPARVSFAVSGDWVSRMDNPLIRVSKQLESPLERPSGQVFKTEHRSLPGHALTWVAYSFSFDPSKARAIKVFFYARWLSSSEDGGSCWLSLPSLMGGTNEAFGAANQVIGHPDWSKDQRGAPIYSAGNYLDIAGHALRLDAAHSVPLPSSLDQPSWGCVAEHEGGDRCEAYVSLERPGVEEDRVRQLSRSTLIQGLLLGLLLTMIVNAGHLILQTSRFG